MNKKNYEYLKDNIKYLGFGENQHEALQRHLQEGKSAFQLIYNADINKKPFQAALQFRKSDNSDMYFLNSYHATLERKNGEKKEQTFYLNNGKGVTAKEAFNLLEGRSVHKELATKENEPYKAWIQLDFTHKDKHNNNEVKQYHENYGYDLKAAVSKYAVEEMNNPEKEKSLLQSLQKGNIQSVTTQKDGNEKKMFIEANPQFKSINLFDSQMKKIRKEDLNLYMATGQSQGKEIKQEQKQELKQGKSKTTTQKQNNQMQNPAKKNAPKKRVAMG